jgi:hypothetical protein
MRIAVIAAVLAAVVFGGASLSTSEAKTPGARLHTRTMTATATVPSGQIGSVTAWCNSREVATGGGYSVGSINGANNAYVNGPVFEATTGLWGWTVPVTNDPGVGFPVQFWATAICTPGTSD